MTSGVVFMSRMSTGAPSSLFGSLESTLAGIDGWVVDPQVTAGRAPTARVRCYLAGPFQAIDVFGLFEAPDENAAHDGIGRLQAAGWDRAFATTSWLVGPRDLPPSPGDGPHPRALGFLALWDWNDAWHAATPGERDAYDEECDVAFRYDVELGIDLFGRFRTSAQSGWEQLSVWECPDLETLTRAMGAHEAQRDFMFTTSSHFVGRAMEFGDLRRSIR